MSVIIHVVHRNFLHYSLLTCKSLVIVMVNGRGDVHREISNFRLLGSLGKFLLTVEETSGSIPISAMRFFSSGLLFHSIYRLGLSVFQCLCQCSFLCSLGRRPLQSDAHRSLRSAPSEPVFLYVVHRNILHYRAQAYKLLRGTIKREETKNKNI